MNTYEFEIPVKEINEILLTVTAENKKQAKKWIKSYIDGYGEKQKSVPVAFYDLESKKFSMGSITKRKNLSTKLIMKKEIIRWI